ncbi:SET domain-containing protein SmydA-8-like isoform X2 [Bacillus rossius redtenbacheri]|uniref:SET domain-containing protein SmydA-8-like isoform X2 n=1 Tax=Bacillus rossius redtenbacheri TaxID=93214 RepID=UPI002FDE72C3
MVMGVETCAVCTQPANQRCGACHVTYYCSRDHQRTDWKAHRQQCKPLCFKVCEDAVLGRHLVATRDILMGEVVLKESPLVAGPAQITVPVCLGCYSILTAESAQPCTACGWPMCSSNCESSSAHAPECYFTATRHGSKVSVSNFGMSHPLYQCVTVLRLLHQRSHKPAAWGKLAALESHCQQRRRTPRYEDDRVAIAQFARRFFKLDEFSEEDILRACGTIQVNGHEVPLTEPAHIAVYDTASLLEHNCRPNCSKSFTATGGLIVRAAMPIERGQHLSICYSDALWGTASRRHHLAETKFFWCTCERCADPTECGTFFSALHCTCTSCEGFLLPEEPLKEGAALEAAGWWSCTSCGGRLSPSDVQVIVDGVGRRLVNMQKGDPASCERFVAQCEGELHPNHYYLTDVRLALAQLYGQDHVDALRGTPEPELRGKARLCRDVLSLVERLAPAEGRVRGVLQFELHATLAEMARRAAGRGELDHVELSNSLLESKHLLTEAVFLLEYEPDSLPEGQVVIQAKRNLQEIDNLLQSIHDTIGDSPM